MQRISPSTPHDIRFLGGEPGAIKKGKGCGIFELFSAIISGLKAVFACIFSSSVQNDKLENIKKKEIVAIAPASEKIIHIESASKRVLDKPIPLDVQATFREYKLGWESGLESIEVTEEEKQQPSYQLALAIVEGNELEIIDVLKKMYPDAETRVKKAAADLLENRDSFLASQKGVLPKDARSIIKFAKQCARKPFEKYKLTCGFSEKTFELNKEKLSYKLALAFVKGDEKTILGRLKTLHPHYGVNELKKIVKKLIACRPEENAFSNSDFDYFALSFASKCIEKLLDLPFSKNKSITASKLDTKILVSSESDEDLITTSNAALSELENDVKTESTEPASKKAEFRASKLLAIINQLQEEEGSIKSSDLQDITPASAQPVITDYIGKFFKTAVSRWQLMIEEKAGGLSKGLEFTILNSSFDHLLAKTLLEGEGDEIQMYLKSMIQDGKELVDDQSDKELELAVKQFLLYRNSNMDAVRKAFSPGFEGESLSAVAIASVLVRGFLRTAS